MSKPVEQFIEDLNYLAFKQEVERGTNKAVDWNWFTPEQITRYTERMTKELTNGNTK